jgi:cytochrome b subunit of formate dehydrogenase
MVRAVAKDHPQLNLLKPSSGLRATVAATEGLSKTATRRCGTVAGFGHWSYVLIALVLLWPRLLVAQCLECHGDRDFTTTDSAGQTVSLYVDSTTLAKSIHDGFDCIDCHTAATSIPHAEHLPPVDCGECHSDVAATYKVHGLVKENPAERFPDCHHCHGTHDILPPSDPNSSANPNNLPTTCGRCHQDKSIVGAYHIPMITPVETYETSVHSRRRADSSLVATCIDCHSTEKTAHSILAPLYPQSTIYHFNIAATCGRCHAQVQADYERGVHGQAAARGETDTPVCTDCHGSHVILPVENPKSRVNPIRVSLTVCAPCHEDEELNIKYGLPTNIMRTWRHSYHGLKSTDGDPRVANCSSCHRAHLILPASDSASSIAPANVHTTCAKCHASISQELAKIEIHKTTGVFLNKTGRTFRAIYIIAIIVIIGAMVVHWMINLSKRVRVLNHGRQVVRMNRNELWQHTFLMVTFTILAITGFAFHYSGSWWARFLFGWPGGFVARRMIHLVAAVLFAGTAVWHMIYLFGQRGRLFLRDIFPRVQDFRQFFHTMAYDLGLRTEAPRFGRFSYVEKAEYWALVWGTVVMTVTGVSLWFGTVTENILKVGAVGVMLVIHFYEAILAGLAILIWHFYSTIFNPPVYPNNPSWYTGKMPLVMHDEEHADDPILILRPERLVKDALPERPGSSVKTAEEKTGEERPEEPRPS